MATREGVCQAVFLEGGLSKDGYLRPPKFGLIDYMLRSFNSDEDRNVVFIPVGINYDRVIEDRSLLRRLNPDSKRRSLPFVVKTTLGFIIRNFYQMALRKWKRFGYACVNFGDPISVKELVKVNNIDFKTITKEERFKRIEELCHYLMASIKKVIPVLPVALVSTVFADFNEEPKSLFEVKSAIDRLINEIRLNGALIYFPKHNFEKYTETALELLKVRHMIFESENLYRANPEMMDILSYYANSIVHWRESKLHSDRL